MLLKKVLIQFLIKKPYKIALLLFAMATINMQNQSSSLTGRKLYKDKYYGFLG